MLIMFTHINYDAGMAVDFNEPELIMFRSILKNTNKETTACDRPSR